MRYYLYCTDNNRDLDVGLMYLNIVQFDCVHLNYTRCVQSIIEVGSLNINDDTADSNIICNIIWPVFSLFIAVSSIILSIAGFQWGPLCENTDNLALCSFLWTRTRFFNVFRKLSVQ